MAQVDLPEPKNVGEWALDLLIVIAAVKISSLFLIAPGVTIGDQPLAVAAVAGIKLQSAYDCIADLSAVVAPAVEEVEVDDLGDEPVEETAAEADPMEALDAAEQIIIDATEDYDEDLNEVMKPYE
jgi:hypothetical protein